MDFAQALNGLSPTEAAKVSTALLTSTLSRGQRRYLGSLRLASPAVQQLIATNQLKMQDGPAFTHVQVTQAGGTFDIIQASDLQFNGVKNFNANYLDADNDLQVEKFVLEYGALFTPQNAPLTNIQRITPSVISQVQFGNTTYVQDPNNLSAYVPSQLLTAELRIAVANEVKGVYSIGDLFIKGVASQQDDVKSKWTELDNFVTVRAQMPISAQVVFADGASLPSTYTYTDSEGAEVTVNWYHFLKLSMYGLKTRPFQAS